MPLLITSLFLVIFATDVAIGSFGGKVFLTDVQEMLVLIAASISFVVAILKKESAQRRKDKAASDQREELN